MQSRIKRTICNPSRMVIPPGPALVSAAEARGGSTAQWVDELTRRSLYGRPAKVILQVEANSISEPVSLVPGHLWGEIDSFWSSFSGDTPAPHLGPVPAEVMVLGKWLDEEEAVCNRHMAGAAGEKLRSMLVEAGLSGFDKWYITSLIKFAPPQGIDRIPSSWLRDAGYLLNQEMRIVKPKYLLCLGADAARAVLGRTKEGKVQKVSVGQLSGEVVEYQIPDTNHKVQVMVIPHPRALMRAKVDADTRTTVAQLQRFNHLVTGRWGEGEEDLDHFGCYTLEQAEEFLDQARKELAESGETRVAWDAEWHGRRPVNKDAYLRTIQLTWREKQAVTFVLRRKGGVPCFVDQHGRPAEKRLFKLLTKFGLEYGAIGHFLVSDLEWLDHFGVKITKSFDVPRQGFRPWDELKKGRTGWCTGMAAHAIEETAPLGLDSLAIRYTSAPRYDLAIEDWIQEYCKQHNIKRANLNGFGECPDEKLVGIVGPDGRLKKSYTCYDTDVTFRIYKRQQELLSKEYFGLDCWQPFWEAMLIQPVLLECHRTGLRLDMVKFTNLTKKFVKARDRIADEVRQAANWPEMNLNSTEQVREYLFGEHLNGKKLKPGELFKRLRPPGAVSLGLTPELTTEKPPRSWSDVVASDEVHKVKPGTGKTSLALLRFNTPAFKDQIQRIIDYRRIGQMTKTFLRPPQDEEDGSPAAGWDFDIPLSGEAGSVGFIPVHIEQFTFDKGIAASLDDDGRIRTHLSPTTDTGRWRSWDPNLQNASKRYDKEYERLLKGIDLHDGSKPGYCYPIRSLFDAGEFDGVPWVIIESDFAGAELMMMAVMSGDLTMIDHASRASLPDGHPNQYDIHSTVTVMAFKLDCPASKAGLASIGKKDLRDMAKTIMFGMAYGRSAKAIAMTAKEQNVDLTVDEAQAVIDAIFTLYPKLVPFYNEAKRRAVEERWISSCFGRRRRFPPAMSNAAGKEFGRQGMNFPIQSGVGGCLNRGVANLYWALESWKEQLGGWRPAKIALTVHDSVVLIAHPAYVDALANPAGLIKQQMCDSVPIYPTDLSGKPLGTGPYYLGIDTKVYEQWGVGISKARCQELGIPECYGKA